jgi:hypothetical protein
MKTKMNLIAAIVSVALIFSTTITNAQIRGNGNVISELRNPGAFSSVKVNNSIDIYITEGSSNSITVKADENLLPIISTVVSNGVLEISNSRSYQNAEVLEVHLTMENIDKLSSTGSGDIYCEGVSGNNVQILLNGSGDFNGDFNIKNLQLKLNGSGDADVSGVRGALQIYISGSGDVEAESLQLESCVIKIMGSGDIKLKGSAAKLTVKQTGSGDVNAYNLKAVDVTISNSGSGDIVIHAIDNLDVSLQGSGDVSYSGSPRVNIESHGSGEVYKR